jgi:hypothetical protein
MEYLPIYVPSDSYVLNIYDKCAAERLYLPLALPQGTNMKGKNEFF